MKKDFAGMLQKAGFKVTPARVAVLTVFSEDCKPIDADYIYSRVKGKKVNQTTVYRTLTSFEKTGILKRVDLRKDSVFYELYGHHHHIVCTDCGTVEEFELCGVEKISKQILGRSVQFSSIFEHSLELFGVCKSCEKR